MLGQTYLQDSSGIWALGKTCVCLLGLATGLSIPQTMTHSPEPDDVLRSNVSCDV